MSTLVYEKINNGASAANYWTWLRYELSGSTLTLSAGIARQVLDSSIGARYHDRPVTFTLKVGTTLGGNELNIPQKSAIAAMAGANSGSWGTGNFELGGREYVIYENQVVQLNLNDVTTIYLTFYWNDYSSATHWAASNSNQTVSKTLTMSDYYWKIIYNPTAGIITTPTQFVEKGQSATLYSLGSGVVNTNAANLKFYKSATETLEAGTSFTPTEDTTLTTLWQYRLTYNFGSNYPAGTKFYANGVETTTVGYGTGLTSWSTYISDKVTAKLADGKTSVTGTDSYIYYPANATQKLVALNTSPALTDPNITLGTLDRTIDGNKTYYAVWAANTTQVTFESDNFTKVKSLKWKYSTDSSYTTINRGALSKFTINALYNSTINFYFEPEDGYEAQYTVENTGTKVINTTSPIKIIFTITGKEVDVKVIRDTYTSIIPSKVGATLDLSTYATAKKTQTEVGTADVTFDLSNSGDSSATFKSTSTQTKTQTYTQYEDKVYNWESWKDKNNNTHATTSIEILPNMVTDDVVTLTAVYSENYITRYEVATINLATYTADISSSFTLEGWYDEAGTEKYGEPNSTYSIPLSMTEISTFTFYGYFNTTADPGIYVLESGTWKKIFNVDASNFLKLI